MLRDTRRSNQGFATTERSGIGWQVGGRFRKEGTRILGHGSCCGIAEANNTAKQFSFNKKKRAKEKNIQGSKEKKYSLSRRNRASGRIRCRNDTDIRTIRQAL